MGEDIRIMYSFTGEKSKELSERYVADSQEDVLVLLDTTPDQEMLDEGVAREVVNRIQKLRKSAGLKVDDQVRLVYSVTPSDHHLATVIKKFSDYIQTSSKTPLELLTSPPKDCIKKESYDLKGAKLELVVTPGDKTPVSPSGPGSNPVTGWLNMVLLGSPPSYHVGSNLAGILLPGSAKNIDVATLTELAQDVFGLYNVKLDLFTTKERTEKLSVVKAGSTVFVSRWNDQDGGSAVSSDGFNCNFVNVNVGGKTESVLLENPRGKSLNVTEAFRNLTKGKKMKLFADNSKKKEVSMGSLSSFVGQTLYL